MWRIRKLAIAIGILFPIPILFFVEGILVGMFFPSVPRSAFYEYYGFMFPALLSPGIIMATFYLILFLKKK